MFFKFALFLTKKIVSPSIPFEEFALYNSYYAYIKYKQMLKIKTKQAILVFVVMYNLKSNEKVQINFSHRIFLNIWIAYFT